MSSKEDVRTLLGIIGNIISLILFLSPVPTFYQIWKKKSVEQYSAVPYVATIANCMLWVLYGLPMVHPHSTLVVTINGTGFVIEILYLSLFLMFSDAKKRRRVVAIVAAECLTVGVLGSLVLALAKTWKLRSAVVGSVCMAGSIVMYASPLSVMKLVMSTRSVEYMPFFLSLFSFLNGLTWTSYALIPFDPFMAVPNGMGALLGLAQLLLYAIFYRSTKRIMAERRAQSEMDLTEIKSSGPRRY